MNRNPSKERHMSADYTDLVAVSDVAHRLHCDGPRVSMWIQRHDDFPSPVALVGGRRLYSWRGVASWCRRHGYLAPEPGHIYDDAGRDVTDQYRKKTL